MDAKEVLFAYVEDYFDAIAALSYSDLQSRQHGFHSSLAFGAAGIAYACWYAGSMLDDGELLDEAERWVAMTAGRERDRLSFLVPLSELQERPASHYLYGEAGLVFVRVLVAHARHDAPAREAALTRFLELARQSKDEPPELYNGTTGCLIATAILYRYAGDARLRQLGDELTSDLLGRAAPEADGMVLWPELTGLGLSHGSSGPYLALLLHSIATGSPLPAWFAPSLTNLLDLVVRDPSRLCPSDLYHPMLCNGFTGLAFLGARAYQTLGGEALREGALGAARLALARTPEEADLCCGRAGAAFTALALARTDPEGPWKRMATDLALSTLLREREEWPNAGLFGGEAALPCLALSLTEGLAAGPPGLDLVDLPAPVPGSQPQAESPR